MTRQVLSLIPAAVIPSSSTSTTYAATTNEVVACKDTLVVFERALYHGKYCLATELYTPEIEAHMRSLVMEQGDNLAKIPTDLRAKVPAKSRLQEYARRVEELGPDQWFGRKESMEDPFLILMGGLLSTWSKEKRKYTQKIVTRTQHAQDYYERYRKWHEKDKINKHCKKNKINDCLGKDDYKMKKAKDDDRNQVNYIKWASGEKQSIDLSSLRKFDKWESSLNQSDDWVAEQQAIIQLDRKFLDELDKMAGGQTRRNYWMKNLRTEKEKQLAVLMCGGIS